MKALHCFNKTYQAKIIRYEKYYIGKKNSVGEYASQDIEHSSQDLEYTSQEL